MSVWTVKIAGQPFGEVVKGRISRDLENLAATFEITLVDQARLARALVAQIGQPTPNHPIKRGDSITILIDNEPVLVGNINRPRFRWTADQIECQIYGRDRTGDLVDCAASPNGPTEFKGVDLLHVANQVCSPFGIPARADVDIGAPFDRLALHKHQTGRTFLESASRQRSILLTSDGIGGLLLTRGGSTRGPAALAIGDNVQEVDVEYDEEQRYSDYYVMQDTTLKRTGAPALSSDVAPDPDDDGSTDDTPGAATAMEATAIGSVGHAIDPEVTRYRPTVRLTRSQSGMSSVQEQAEWACRVAKGISDRVRMKVLGHRAGPNQVLWRPNQIVPVFDPYSGIDRDMLIAGVALEKGPTGEFTWLRVAGPSAYDRINESDRKKSQTKKPAAKRDLITTVPPMDAP